MKTKKYKKAIIGVLATTAIVSGSWAYFHSNTSENSPNQAINSTPMSQAIPNNHCNAGLWNYVYHPKRLQIEKDCAYVSGTIYSIKKEADGDLHIRLDVDLAYKDLINPVNVSGQKGMLVIEPICQEQVSQADAIDACKDFPYPRLLIPKVGIHVGVWGTQILDNQHNGWREIHPVTEIVVLN